jgi:polysaccharide pyruvyl transferase CsaB
MACRLVLAGYFGCGNLGDDSILAGLLEGISQLPVAPVVLSGSPEATRRQYGVDAVPRMNFGAVKRALEGAEALVLGGGSLFQDVTSVRSAAYYSKLVAMGKKATGRVIMLGQGFGPVRRFLGRAATASALRRATAIAVRDEDSFRLARSLGATCEIMLAADMAWLARPDPHASGGAFGVGDQKAVGLVPRAWARSKAIAEVFMLFSRHLSEDGTLPLMLPFDEAADRKLYNDMSRLGIGVPSVLKGIRTPDAMMARVQRLDGMVTMRYHGAVFAAKAGIPPLLVSYDPKVTALAGILGVPAAIPIEGLTIDRLVAAWDGLQARRGELVTKIDLVRRTMEEEARRNIDLLRRHVPSLADATKTEPS